MNKKFLVNIQDENFTSEKQKDKIRDKISRALGKQYLNLNEYKVEVHIQKKTWRKKVRIFMMVLLGVY